MLLSLIISRLPRDSAHYHIWWQRWDSIAVGRYAIPTAHDYKVRTEFQAERELEERDDGNKRCRSRNGPCVGHEKLLLENRKKWEEEIVEERRRREEEMAAERRQQQEQIERLMRLVEESHTEQAETS